MASESLIYRIKAIWQGDRATAEASRDIQNVGKAGDKTTSKLQSVMGKAAIAGAAIAGAAYTARQGWEALGEGADMLRIEDKFAAAAEHIGTTASSLKDAVMEATGGMISEAEATAGALELIDTGLASNQDEVVRLSRLVGELGWDMQALTLTMLNDSEKRLDTLGLSTERVAELEQKYLDLGIAHEQAFDLAVMDAGEEKLAIYGSRAESLAGQMDQIESSWANIVNHMKQSAALAAGPIISSYAQQLSAQERIQQLLEQGVITEREHSRLRQGIRRAGADMLEDEIAGWEAVIQEAETADRVMTQYNTSIEEGSAAANDYSQHLIELARAGQEAAEKQQWIAERTTELSEAYRKATEEGDYWRESNAALSRQMGGPFLRALEEGDEEGQNFINTMLNAAAQNGATAESLGVLAAATGEYSDEQIEAAINTAAMVAKAEQLGAAVADGALSADEALEAFRNFQQQLLEPYEMEVVAETDKALGDIENVRVAADAAAGDRWLNFRVNTIGSMPVVTGSQATGIVEGANNARASGGPVMSGTPYLVGERGPEWFIPNQSGTILPNGQQPPGGGSYVDNRVYNFRSREAAALGMAQAHLERRKRARDYMGVS